MVCSKLNRGFNGLCESKTGRFVQKAVLINYTDVVFQAINDSQTMHNVVFALFNPTKPNQPLKMGYDFTAPIVSDAIFSEYSMNRDKGVVTYEHSLEVILSGVDERLKVLQKQLDSGLFLGATKYSDGTIQILGSENGLIVNPYEYRDSGKLRLSSASREYALPYVYAGDEEDFDSGWNSSQQAIKIAGDFNDDFSKDFRVDFLLV